MLAVAVVTLSLYPAAACDPARLAVSAADTARAAALVRNLGHADYLTRERSQRQLAGMGRLARPALMAGRLDPSLEVRERVGELLPNAAADDLAARLALFRLDAAGRFEHDLPGWGHLRAACGDAPEARRLMAAMLTNPDNHALLNTVDAIPGSARLGAAALAGGPLARPGPPRPGPLLAALTARRAFVQSQMNAPANRLEPGYRAGLGVGGVPVPDIAAMLLAETAAPDVRTPPAQGLSLAGTYFYQPPGRALILGQGEYGRAGRSLSLAWLESRRGVNDLYMAMNVAANTGLPPETVARLAARLMVEPQALPWHRGYAAGRLVALDARGHLLDLTRGFADEDVYSQARGAAGVAPTILVRDAMLAAAVQLTGQKPGDYGLESPPGGPPNQQLFFFRDDPAPVANARTADRKRAAAFAKWGEWEGATFGALGGPAAALPLLQAAHRPVGPPAPPAPAPGAAKAALTN